MKESMRFVLDMDGVLVKSNEANFLSYKEAFELVTKTNFPLKYNGSRFTSNTLKNNFPELTKKQFNKIIKEKAKIFHNYLSYTVINQNLLNEILVLPPPLQIFLCTNAKKYRTSEIVKYHNLDFLTGIYCNKNPNENKFLNFINHYNFDPKYLIVFEDEDKQISCALQAGILEQNIRKIGICDEK